MKKSLTSLLLVVCMVFSLSINVFATGVEKLTVNAPISVQSGEEFNITVTSSQLKSSLLGFTLTYDAGAAECISTNEGEWGKATIVEGESDITVTLIDISSMFSGGSTIKEGTVLFEATFVVSETTAFEISKAENATGVGGINVSVTEIEGSQALVEVGEHTHYWDTVSEVPATCTSEGVTKHGVCRCGETDGKQVIPILPHSEELVGGKKATCTETGLSDGKKCSVCGQVLLAQVEIPKTPHEFNTESDICAICGAENPANINNSNLSDLYFSREVALINSEGNIKNSYSPEIKNISEGDEFWFRIIGMRKDENGGWNVDKNWSVEGSDSPLVESYGFKILNEAFGKLAAGAYVKVKLKDDFSAATENEISFQFRIIDSSDGTYSNNVVVNYPIPTNQWLYEERNNGELWLTGYDGYLIGEVTIPAEINGKSVNRVFGDGLANQIGITKVTVEEGIYRLQGYIFNGCTALTEVNLPDNLTYIGKCFSNCDNLKVINYAGSEAQWNAVDKEDDTIPEGVTLNFGREMTNKWLYEADGDEWAYITCFDGILEGEITIPATIDGKEVYCIENRALAGQTKITKVIIEEGIERLQGYIFNGCTALTEVNLPESLTYIGKCFSNCDNLKVINYAGSEAQWNAVDKEDDTIPEGVTLNFGREMTNKWLCEEQDYDILYLTGYDGILEGEITIPATIDGKKVKRIDSRALAGQTKITKVILAEGIQVMSSSIFANCSALTEVTLPESILYLNSSFRYCDSLRVINYAGSEVQWNALNVEDANIPEGVTINFLKQPSNKWFYEVYDKGVYLTGFDGYLTGEVIIPAEVDGYKVDGLDENILKNRTAVTKVVIEEGIQTISGYAFSGCTALEEIDIPVTFYNYGMQIFDGCTNLKTINYRGTETEWNSLHITDLVTIPENITINFLGEVSNQWLYRENGDGTLTLTGFDGVLEGEVIIPSEIDGKTVIRIDGRRNENGRYVNTFEGQDNITSIVIPDTVLEINSIADGNQALQSVTIPSSVQRVWSGDNPFQNCAALENFILTGENHAFRFENGMLSYKEHLVHCVNSVSGVCEIPKGITFIHHQAFSSCDKLTHIVFPEGITKIGRSWGLDKCSSLTTVTIPVSVTKIENMVFFNGLTGPIALTDIYYNGTEEQWNVIEFGSYNENILNANIHFSEEPVYETGDPNGDNEINSADVNLLYRAVMDYANLTDAQKSAADVNNDGKVNSADVNLLYRYVMGYVQNLTA